MAIAPALPAAAPPPAVKASGNMSTTTPAVAQTQAAAPVKAAPATLTADFSSPVATTPKAPPAVITSSAAEKHLANAKTQVGNLASDVISQAAAKATAPSTTDLSSETPDATASPTDSSANSTSIDDQINGILSDLDTKLSTSETNSSNSTTDLEQQIADTQTQETQQAADTATKLQSIADGTYPLSDTEQGLLSSTIAGYESTISAQEQANSAFTGKMAETLASLGIDQSAATEAIGLVHATISSGVSKIADLTSKMTTAVSNLQVKMQTQDYNQVQKAWTSVSSAFKDRLDALTKLHTDVTTDSKAAQTALVNQAKTNITALVDSGKLTQTDAKNAVDSLYKQGTLNAKEYANITARMKAAAATPKPPATSVTSTEQWLNNTRGTDGYVDPNAYKQAFDGWLSDGYQAKDFLKAYPPKAFVNPSNNWLPAYLESKTPAAAAKASVASSAASPF